MAKHNNTGRRGEELAVAWFVNNGYQILHKSWRHRNLEIDLLAAKEEVLHIIEVKTRTNQNFGYPEDGVGQKKIENMIDAADEYLQLYPKWKRIQFDILSITITGPNEAYFLIEDVYL